MNKKTIALDFDGVLHGYREGWKDGTIYDEPVADAVSCCKVLAMSFNLVVFTTRRDKTGVMEWLGRYGFPAMDVVNEKPLAHVYVDDRGYRFENWGKTMVDLNEVLE